MARNALISEKRFKLIEARQGTVRWGAEYQPAMRATRDEAPKVSRPSTMYSTRLGRNLHFMSQAERHVCLLALYHPRTFDIHEQHALQPFEAPHPLAGHKDAYGLSLPPLRGTVAIAVEMGMLTKHPTVWIKDKVSDKENRHAFPYLGDILLYLRDEQGPYCVNWSVKARREDFFDRPAQRSAVATTPSGYCTTLSARHYLEQRYFADAKIPTHFIAAEDLDINVIHNLNSLYARAQTPSALPLDAQEHLIHTFQNIVGTQTTVLSLLPDLLKQFHCSREAILYTLHQAIWRRRIRLDLYRPILVNKPLKVERSNVLLDYAHFFGR